MYLIQILWDGYLLYLIKICHSSEPTICPYGFPYRVWVPSYYASNYHRSKSLIAEVFPSAKQIPDDLELIEVTRDDSPDILKPQNIQKRVCCISTIVARRMLFIKCYLNL